MAQILDNCKYNKIKLLHKLSSMAWFIKKHAVVDAQAAGDSKCATAMDELAADLEKHIKKLHEITCK